MIKINYVNCDAKVIDELLGLKLSDYTDEKELIEELDTGNGWYEYNNEEDGLTIKMDEHNKVFIVYSLFEDLLSVYRSGLGIESFVLQYFDFEDISQAEFLARFDLDGRVALECAPWDENYNGSVLIWVTHVWGGNIKQVNDGFIKDEYGYPMEFEDINQVEEWLDKEFDDDIYNFKPDCMYSVYTCVKNFL